MDVEACADGAHALHSALMMLLERTPPSDQVQKKTDGLSVLLADLSEACGNDAGIWPQRATVNHNTTEIFNENRKVSVGSCIGEEGKDFRYILDETNAERVTAAYEMVGAARWLIRTVAQYAGERVVLGRLFGKNQGVQFPIARAYTEQGADDMMVRKALAMFVAGLPCGEDANIANLFASETTRHVAAACLQTYGVIGFATEYEVERLWREVCVAQVAQILTNLILSNIAEPTLDMLRSFWKSRSPSTRGDFHASIPHIPPRHLVRGPGRFHAAGKPHRLRVGLAAGAHCHWLPARRHARHDLAPHLRVSFHAPCRRGDGG